MIARLLMLAPSRWMRYKKWEMDTPELRCHSLQWHTTYFNDISFTILPTQIGLVAIASFSLAVIHH
jgi:hypothetical protein